jgi:hypothetical protein
MLLAQVVPPEVSLQSIADIALKAIMGGDYVVIAAALLVLVVFGVRTYGAKLRDVLPDDNVADKALAWLFVSRPGGWVLNILTAIAGALATALLAGAPISWALVQAGLMAALSGAALWELLKDIVGYVTKAQAAKAAAEAAAKVKTSADAIKSINENT